MPRFHSGQGRPFLTLNFRTCSSHCLKAVPFQLLCLANTSLVLQDSGGRASPSVWPFLTFSGKGPTVFWEQEPPAWCRHLGLQRFTRELAPGSRHLAGQYQARALQNSVAPPRKTFFQMGHRLSVSPSLGNMVNLGTRNRPRHGNCGID